MTLKDYSDIVVTKSEFDSQIYLIKYEREESGKKYITSAELAELLNNKKVIIVNKKDRVIHRNFITMAEAIG